EVVRIYGDVNRLWRCYCLTTPATSWVTSQLKKYLNSVGCMYPLGRISLNLPSRFPGHLTSTRMFTTPVKGGMGFNGYCFINTKIEIRIKKVETMADFKQFEKGGQGWDDGGSAGDKGVQLFTPILEALP
ncbi:hypothetical protein M8C21_012788, partial [Ambrosia artemisiifolia]